jgi:hypothetical protein
MIKEPLDKSYHVNMIIDLLLRFPEIHTINFNVSSSSWCLSYMIRGSMDGKAFLELKRKLKNNLEALYFLRHCEKPSSLKVSKNLYSGITRLQITTAGESLPGEAISLLTTTLHDIFPQELMREIPCESGDYLSAMAEPDGGMLSLSQPPARNGKISHLFAFRDAGKVYIYDK